MFKIAQRLPNRELRCWVWKLGKILELDKSAGAPKMKNYLKSLFIFFGEFDVCILYKAIFYEICEYYLLVPDFSLAFSPFKYSGSIEFWLIKSFGELFLVQGHQSQMISLCLKRFFLWELSSSISKSDRVKMSIGFLGMTRPLPLMSHFLTSSAYHHGVTKCGQEMS